MEYTRVFAFLSVNAWYKQICARVGKEELINKTEYYYSGRKKYIIPGLHSTIFCSDPIYLGEIAQSSLQLTDT